MGKVERLIDKQLDTEIEKEIELCLKRLRGLESSLKFFRSGIRGLIEGGPEGLAEELGIIQGKTSDTISALYMLKKINELIDDTIMLWGDSMRKAFEDYLKEAEEN